MSKMTIIEGNSNDKDNVRAYMVKGEPGVSPTIGVSKEDGVTTLTIEDAEGTHTATIADGDDLVGGVPTDGVIGFDGEAADIPDGYEVFDDVNLVKSFNTVAEMKEDEYLVAGDTCQTLGYYSANDGGAGLYKIRDITNGEIVDDGFVIALNNSTLIAELIINNSINTKQIGILTDGITDVTEKLQYLINKVKEKKIKLILSSGIYLITASIDLISRLKMEGVSNNEVIILNNSNDYAFKQNGDSTGIEIKNISIQNGSGILFTNGRSTKSILDNIVMTNVKNGLNYNCGTGYNLNKNILINSTETAIIIGKDVDTSLTNVSPNYIYFDNCYSQTEPNSSYNGLEIDYGEYIFINNCDFVNFENGLCISNSDKSVTNISFSKTTFYNNNKSIYINNKGTVRSIKFNECDFIVKEYLLLKTSNVNARQIKFVNCFGSNTSYVEPTTDIIDVDYMEELEFINYGDFTLQTKRHTKVGNNVTYKNPDMYITKDNIQISNKVTVTSGITFRIQTIGSPLPSRYPVVISNDCNYNINYNNTYKFYDVYISPIGSSGTAYII